MTQNQKNHMVCNLQFPTIVVKKNHESLHFTKKKLELLEHAP